MDKVTKLRRANLLCCHFARNLAYYKARWPEGKPRITNEFWATVNGNSLDLCIVEWCKLFGNRNDTHHWQQVVNNSNQFKKELFISLNMTQSELDDIWNSIKSYRDEFVAHLDKAEIMHIPKLDLAWNTVEYYHECIVAMSESPESIQGLSINLKAYYDKCYQEALVEYAKQT